MLDRAYAIAFVPSSALLPPSAPPLSSFLFPTACELPIPQWFDLLLLDLHALLHQLLVLHVLDAWQTSAPPVSLIWQEDEGLTSPVLDAYQRLYSELDADCQLHGLTAQQRQSLLSVCLRALSTSLFNSVVLGVSNLTMDVGLRLKWVCSALTEYSVRTVGDAFIPRLLPLLECLQELAMVLLMDKSSAQLTELTAVAPHLSLLALHHLLFVFLQSEGNEEDSVSPSLLSQLAQAAANKQQRDGQAPEQSQQLSPALPAQIVLLLDLSSHKHLQPPLSDSDMGMPAVLAMDKERQEGAWGPPEPVDQHPRLHLIVAATTHD